MKIEKKLNGELVFFITESEFKTAFSSEDNYIKFKNRINDLILMNDLINNKYDK